MTDDRPTTYPLAWPHGWLHPDLGGTQDGMAQLNEARDAAMQEIGHG